MTAGDALGAPPPPPQLPTDSQDAVVYVYRASGAAPLRGTYVALDGSKTKVANLRNNHCTLLRLPAGEHKLTAAWSSNILTGGALEPYSLKVSLAPRSVHYYQFSVELEYRTGYVEQRWRLQEVSADIANLVMAECEFDAPLIDAASAFAPSPPPAE